eukprot:TRINITY_DN9574_c0_g1_i1.p1 TRINITY_DN9574_c0_g1~~TRINITY_DN9574_c0_g1_i1.p1  ORF type:complete len:556 (+),score=139.49 TRINITY_DN9574_c0_g1_i1:316-1983(+)
MAKYGLYNAILEVDLTCGHFEPSTALDRNIKQMDIVLDWIESNLSPPAGKKPTIFVNLRDFAAASMTVPKRLVKFVKHIAKRNPKKQLRPAGIIFEEPSGEFLPTEVGAWAAVVRKTMNKCGWKSKWQQDGKTVDGLLLGHIHKAFGRAYSDMDECLYNGADGTWASIAEEGAICGHVCACVMLTNLALCGNQWVLNNYNMPMIAEAARAITKITTGVDVDHRQIVYGPRAADMLLASMELVDFDRNGDGNVDDNDDFALWQLFGMKDQPIRVTGLCPADYMVRRLQQCFGDDNEHCTMEIGEKMRAYLLQEHIINRGDEHSSAVGMAMLCREATGELTPSMEAALKADHGMSERREKLLDQAHAYCDKMASANKLAENGASSTAQRISKASAWDLIQESRAVAVEESRAVAVEEQAKLTDLDKATTDVSDPSAGTAFIDLDEFYSNYIVRYFQSWPRAVMDVLKTTDNKVSWDELEFWCLYSLREHGGGISDVDELHRDMLRSLMYTYKLEQDVHEERRLSKLDQVNVVDELNSTDFRPAKPGRALARAQTRAY